ncbi:uncharacterized protein LOC110240477 [Exaiptasia diaphana]|uniref:Transmembrane protein n=1 Tax=Exaiptasia diaphana TaxID=2652724 RepID=A0A913YIS9_EXADI|nr:uncharacterized protein LOC110240477 [Exaiptasia diaphana]
MAFGKFIESSLCLAVIVAGFFVAVPLRLLEQQTGKTCLLFGQVDFLEKNVTGGKSHYCDLGFYSSIVDIFLASFLICLRWCCLMKTEKPSMIYGSLISFVLATLGWINCLARGVFMITGINEWCSSIKNAGTSSCDKAAISWNWQEFNPQPLDASKSNDFFLMIEVSTIPSLHSHYPVI